MSEFPGAKIIGERLRKLRGDRTLETVAREIGVTSMAVSSWERGKRVPNDELKVKIANFYKKPVAAIFFTV